MKVAIVLLAAALVLGSLIGTLVVRDPGYVLVAYGDVTVETSLWFSLFAIALFGAVLYGIATLIARAIRSGSGVGDWLGRRRSNRARRRTVAGLLLMAEGEWQRARKELLSVAAFAETPLINYLNAARAAHELGDVDDRDRLLRLAHETTPGSRFAVALTQAQLHLDKAEWEQCLATLIRLREESPKHRLVLSMLLRCHHALQDWEAVQELLPDLTKLKIGDNAEIQRIEEESWIARLDRVAASGNAATHARNTWTEMPKPVRSRTNVRERYIDLLIDGGEHGDAERELREANNVEWDDRWVVRYGRIHADPDGQLKTAERWLKDLSLIHI